MIHPKMHIIPGLPIPAIGKFPIQQANREGWPEINEETWYRMALTIAAQVENAHQFPKVLALCNKKIQTNPAFPADYAKQFLRSPVQQVQDSRGQFHDVPPPPPRPSQAPRSQEVPPPPPPGPPPPKFSLMTNDGPIAFTPDYAVMLNPEDVTWC
jgi:hypothetical protein